MMVVTILSAKEKILSSKPETVWLCERPRIIWGKGTRIRDEEGNIVGAIQSVGIRDPLSVLTHTGREKLGREERGSSYQAMDSVPLSREKFSLRNPAESPERSWTDTGLPAGRVQDQVCRGKPLYRHHEDLRHAFSELIGKEDDLLWNIEVLSHDLLPHKTEGAGIRYFRYSLCPYDYGCPRGDYRI